MTHLEIKNLTITDTRTGARLVDNLSLTLERRQCLGLVGESGSGKSLTARAVMGLLAPGLKAEGQIRFNGRNLMELGPDERREIRGRSIGLIVQEAQSAFNPLYKIGRQMAATLGRRLNLSRAEGARISIEALKRFSLSDAESLMDKYPHQLSGGMLQRVMGALTLALEPELIIADEPTTALDSLTQNEVIGEFEKLKANGPASLIFISHDLGVVARLADRAAVMQSGRLVEEGPLKDVFGCPRHRHTQKLVAAHQALGANFGRLIAGGLDQ